MRMRLVHDFGEVAVRVVQYLRDNDISLRATELARTLGEDISRSSVWKCLDTLWKRGLAEKDEDGRFSISRENADRHLEWLAKGPTAIMVTRSRAPTGET